MRRRRGYLLLSLASGAMTAAGLSGCSGKVIVSDAAPEGGGSLGGGSSNGAGGTVSSPIGVVGTIVDPSSGSSGIVETGGYPPGSLIGSVIIDAGTGPMLGLVAGAGGEAGVGGEAGLPEGGSASEAGSSGAAGS